MRSIVIFILLSLCGVSIAVAELQILTCEERPTNYKDP